MFLQVLQFCRVSIIPPVLLTHFHLITKPIRRDAGESLETKKSMPVRISVSAEKEFTFKLFLFGFVKVVARPQCRYLRWIRWYAQLFHMSVRLSIFSDCSQRKSRICGIKCISLYYLQGTERCVGEVFFLSWSRNFARLFFYYLQNFITVFIRAGCILVSCVHSVLTRPVSVGLISILPS